MQYDIFISYSRKDSLQVNSLIGRLRREIHGIKIWYDIDGIETAEAFRSKIISALDESQLVLFACSDNSLASEYCEKEIMYAKNIGKTVIPYLLPGRRLKGWLLFEFGNINCVDSTKEDEVSRMIRDIKLWINHNSTSVQNDMATRIGEFKQKSQPSSDIANECVTGYINGHEYVDLGLPSGLKWASNNVGASKPEEYGVYFAWGETKPKSSYTERNIETYKKIDQTLKSGGYTTENGDLTLLHDAARQNCGGSWRMPTKKGIDELVDNS